MISSAYLGNDDPRSFRPIQPRPPVVINPGETKRVESANGVRMDVSNETDYVMRIANARES